MQFELRLNGPGAALATLGVNVLLGITFHKHSNV